MADKEACDEAMKVKDREIGNHGDNGPRCPMKKLFFRRIQSSHEQKSTKES
jgi:hypothetical protein